MSKSYLITLFAISSLLTGCTYLENQRNQINNQTQEEDQLQDDKSKSTQEIEITTSCSDGNIDKYLSEGWIIKDKKTQSKTCSWKSVPSRPGCNMDLEKGCRVNVPDQVGEETIYILERKGS